MSRVKRRSCIRIVRFCRSTKLVEICSASGSPDRTLDITPRDAWWGVPRIGSIELPIVAEYLRQFSKVGVQAETVGNTIGVVSKPISGDLHPPLDAVVQVCEELRRIPHKALTHVKRRNQFGLGVDGAKHPLITELGRIAFSDTALFLPDEGPDFIDLEIPSVQSADLGVHHAGAVVSGYKQKPHDRVPVQASEPFRAANGAALKQALNCSHRQIGARDHRIPRQLFVEFRKSVLARSTFPALDSTFAEGASLHADRVLASDTGHGLFSACVEREKPYNHFGSGLRLTPRFGLAPQPVRAGSGALSVSYVLGWWLDRDLYGLTGSECNLDSQDHAAFILSESPVAAGLSHFTPKSFTLRVLQFEALMGSKIGSVFYQLFQFQTISFLAFRVPHFLDFSLFLHAAQRRVNRCHRVGIARQIHNFSKDYQTSNLCRHHRSACNHYGSDSVGEALFTAEFLKPSQVLILHVFVLACIGKSANSSRIRGDYDVRLLSLPQCVFQFLEQVINRHIERMNLRHGHTLYGHIIRSKQ